MARMKTKGTTIGVQLPISIDAVVRHRADAAGVSPGVWIARLVIAYIRHDLDNFGQRDTA